MIDTERMQEIMVALTLGKPVTPANDEERKCITDLKKDIERIKKEGRQVFIPSDWP